jgi:putative nucleotidyltransferase with HDIG domain
VNNNRIFFEDTIIKNAVFLLTGPRHSIITRRFNLPAALIAGIDKETTLNRIARYHTEPHCDTTVPASKLSTIATALAIKDPYTREHNCRVAIYARRLAERIGLNATAVKNIRLGGLLHDIGKIGLSAKVLNNKLDQLSGDMLAEVHLHPLTGATILRDFNVPAAVIDFVQYHHEKMDGSGYPFGLKSDQIPLGAKIIRVADCFDAITTDRPYQQRKSWIEALAILRQLSGTDLSPLLVQAFIADIKEKGLALDPTRSMAFYSPVSVRRF